MTDIPLLLAGWEEARKGRKVDAQNLRLRVAGQKVADALRETDEREKDVRGAVTSALNDALMVIAMFAPHGMDSRRPGDYAAAEQATAAIDRAIAALASSVGLRDEPAA